MFNDLSLVQLLGKNLVSSLIKTIFKKHACTYKTKCKKLMLKKVISDD